MRKVFLITGFNNWGKTTLLSDLFRKKAFLKRMPHYFANCPFLVMPKSNDDLGKTGYEDEFNDRLQKYEEANGRAKYIASAFCPTREPVNDSIKILRTLFANDQIEMLLLENKWCDHAKLLVPEVKAFYSGESNVTVHTITSSDPAGKLSDAQAVFSSKLP